MKNIGQKNLYILLCIAIVTISAALLFLEALKPEDITEKKDVILSSSDVVGNHLYKEYNDSFKVDADIPASFNDKAVVLFAKQGLACDEKMILATFFNKNNPVRNTYTSSGIEVVTYEDKDKFASITSGSIHYTSAQYQYVALPTERFNTKSQYINSFPRYDEIYKQDNLSFMPREEVIDKVKEILNNLAIEVWDNVEVYAIDHQTMQEQQNQIIQVNPNITSMYKTKNKFTKDDDFYLLCFTVVQNDIPITPYNYSYQGGDRSISGSEVKVYFSKDGIFYFEARGMYLVKGTAESPDKLITAQEAIDKAFEIHNSIITTDKLVVEEVNFEYGFVPYNQNYDEIKLTPTWTLRLSYEIEDSHSEDGKNDKTSQEDKLIEIMAINAVTGEKIN